MTTPTPTEHSMFDERFRGYDDDLERDLTEAIKRHLIDRGQDDPIEFARAVDIMPSAAGLALRAGTWNFRYAARVAHKLGIRIEIHTFDES